MLPCTFSALDPSQMTSKCGQKTCGTRGAFVFNIKFGVYLAILAINNRKCLFKCGILTYKTTQTPLKKKSPKKLYSIFTGSEDVI